MPVEKVIGNSGSYQGRKSSKPLMEKRRRARINSSLNELKNLILDTYRKDGNAPHHSKLEKADILEIAVQHVRSLQRQQMAAAVSTDPAALGRYRAGYSRCRAEVSRFLGTVDGVDPQVRQKLLNHLDNSCHTVAAKVDSGAAQTVHHLQHVRLQTADTVIRTAALTSHRTVSPALPAAPGTAYGGVPRGELAAVILAAPAPNCGQHLVPVYLSNVPVSAPAELSPAHGLKLAPSPSGLNTDNEAVPFHQFVSAKTAVSPVHTKSASPVPPVSQPEKMWRPW